MQWNLECLPVQWDYLTDDSPWSLIYGGRGSCKSTCLCMGAYARALYPGASEHMFRQKLVDFKNTTLRNLLYGVGGFPPVIPPGTYEHNKSERRISIHGGGEIVYNGMDQGDVGRTMGSTGKGSSVNATGAHFDECVEMEEAAVVQVCIGVRVKIPGLPMVRRFACNPSLPSNWVAKRWGLALDHKPRKGHVWRHARPVDNWHLPAESIEELEALDGIARERYLLGKWVGSDGMVFDRFSRETHVRDHKKNWKKQLIGVDDGYTDPFVVLDIRMDHDGRYHIAREVYQTKLVQTEKIARVKALWDGEGDVFVDSAEPDLIESMKRAGIRAFAADKGQGSINFGINVVQTLLTERDDGLPALTVDPNCTNMIREFESYEWEPDKDRPRDRDNHTPDALRYALRGDFVERGLRVLGTPDPEPAEAVSTVGYFDKQREDPDWGF